jgi:hypothetical protein
LVILSDVRDGVARLAQVHAAQLDHLVRVDDLGIAPRRRWGCARRLQRRCRRHHRSIRTPAQAPPRGRRLARRIHYSAKPARQARAVVDRLCCKSPVESNAYVHEQERPKADEPDKSGGNGCDCDVGRQGHQPPRNSPTGSRSLSFWGIPIRKTALLRASRRIPSNGCPTTAPLTSPRTRSTRQQPWGSSFVSRQSARRNPTASRRRSSKPSNAIMLSCRSCRMLRP